MALDDFTPVVAHIDGDSYQLRKSRGPSGSRVHLYPFKQPLNPLLIGADEDSSEEACAALLEKCVVVLLAIGAKIAR